MRYDEEIGFLYAVHLTRFLGGCFILEKMIASSSSFFDGRKIQKLSGIIIRIPGKLWFLNFV